MIFLQPDGTVLIDTKIKTDGAKTGSEDIKRTLSGTMDYIKLLPQAFKDIPSIMKHTFSSASKSIQSLTPSVRNLQDEVDRYKDALYYAEKAGYGLGDAPYDKALAGLQRAKKAMQDYKKKLLGVDNEQKKASKSGSKLNKSLKGTEKASRGARMGLGRMLATSILFSTVFRSISAVTSGLKEGMDNLAQYSDDTNKALSMLMSGMTQLKNSFATAFSPLVEYAAPALAQFINLLSQAVTWTAQLLAALTGKDTFVKAVKVQQDYADSLDKTKDETKDAAKETEKALAPFDKLIQITTGKKKKEDKNELKPEDMFTTEEVSNDIKLQAEAIKNTLGKLFDPLKESWLENGPQVMKSLQNTFSAIKQLASDVGASFMQVWNVEGYGKAITDDLLITFSNLVDTVGNLVTNFDKAWVSGDTGTNILRHLGDIILEITGFFRQASESLKEWSADLDFTPLLESFDRILIAIKPIVSDVGNLLLWFLNNVLLPIAKWGIEQALPAVFDLIAAALKAIHSVIDALKPVGIWLWEEFLQPLGEWTGGVIIAALEKIVEWLTRFSDWVSQNQTLVENITLAVLAFFAAWKFSEFVLGIGQLISNLGGFMAIGERVISLLARTVSNINPLVLAISGIISLIAVLAKNWNNMSPTEKVIASILAAASAVGILAVALGALAGGVGAGVVAASLAAGIAAATIAINAGKRAASAGYSGGYGGRSAYPMSAYAAVPYRMPMLATGTVVPPRAGMFAAILGDNNRETEVVSPLSTMKQALKEALAESNISGGNQIAKAELILDGTRFGQLVVKFGKNEKNRVGVTMVTEGSA
nr:MAG TPA: minor tail protein [Caudoviricetes sp.]